MFTSRRVTEWLAVGICLLGASVFFYELIASMWPDAGRGVSSGIADSFNWMVVAAVGLALMFGGGGVALVTGARLLAPLLQSSDAVPRAVVIEHLCATALMLAGLALTVVAWSLIGRNV